MLLQVDKCPIGRNAKALFDITKLILKQPDHCHTHNNREGLSIETIIPVITIVREDSITEQNPQTIAKLQIHGIIIINSGVHIAIHTRYPLRSVDIELSELSISHFSMGDHTITIANANVTLTNFQLLSCSHIYSLNTKLTIQGTSLMQNNRGVLFLVNSALAFKGKTDIKDNTGAHFNIITLQKSTITFQGNTTIDNNKGGCLSALIHSKIFIIGNVSFTRNKGYNGGAIALYQGSQIIIGNYTKRDYINIYLGGNYAENYGGGIYIEDYYISHRSLSQPYAMDIPCAIISRTTKNIVTFGGDNRAKITGDNLFGGWGQYCFNAEPNLINFIFISQTNRSGISSSPARVCICINNLPECNKTEYFLTLFPGELIQIKAVAVGQNFGLVPATVRAEAIPSTMRIRDLELLQSVQTTCTKLTYTFELVELDYVYFETLTLKVEGGFNLLQKYQENYPNELLFQDLSLLIVVRHCTAGYNFNPTSGICECDQALVEHGLQCDTQTGKVERKPNMWMNTTSVHLKNQTKSGSGVIVHTFCPLDYCTKEFQYILLNEPDKQCRNNRSEILCGKCSRNLSSVFGSSDCKQCTNYWVLLIVPSTVLAGICLVVLLIQTNLTVSAGTINGLIFYANMVRANQSIFFSSGSSNTFLSWFIAWLNLDIGFEVCFYNGLDTYIKTWLQFVFPIYVWLLVIIIIVSSHYSTRAARLTGNNAVQVLATLFLLSYTKLLRITIVSLSFTTLTYPDGYVHKVWLYDGNVDYLQGKHIALFVAALAVLLFLSIPYTMILVTIQWLQRYTHYGLLRWVTKFLPLFEAYTGPHKNKHRYWPGLLLLVRVILFLVFSLNVVGDPAINLLAITVTMTCILTYCAYVGGVYKSWQFDALEYSFYVNLGILSSATLYTTSSGGNQSQLVFTSTGIAFITFSFIILYHTYRRLLKTSWGAKLKSWTLSKIKLHKQEQDTDSVITEPQPRCASLPTHSVVEMQEPLLDT